MHSACGYACMLCVCMRACVCMHTQMSLTISITITICTYYKTRSIEIKKRPNDKKICISPCMTLPIQLTAT